jgi:hypothetical protein
MEQKDNLIATTTLKVKIIKCSHDKFWYKDRIGEIFNVDDVCAREYYVKPGKGFNLSCILKIDAEIVK